MKDKAKKILKGVVILIIIIIMISAIIVIRSKFLKAEKNIEIKCSELQKTETQNENTIVVGLENQDEEIETVSTEVKEEIQQDETIQTTEQITKEDTKQIEQEKVVKKEVNNTTQQTNKNNVNKKTTENPSQPVITEQPKVDVPSVDNNKNNANESSSNTTNQAILGVKEKNTETKKEETFKYNDAMAQKMIAVIKSNESDYMKEYGYTIVVDESIITLTNQFTYSDQRVKDKLTYKFGQIRVYARDYFVNGEYKWTECYIL